MGRTERHSKVFGLSNRVVVIPSTEMGKIRGGEKEGRAAVGKQFCSGRVKF